MNIGSLTVWQRIALLAGIGLGVVCFGWMITSFLRAIAPSKHSRGTDRMVLRLQKRLFFGKFPLGRFRSAGSESFIKASIVAVWAIVLLIVVLLVGVAL